MSSGRCRVRPSRLSIPLAAVTTVVAFLPLAALAIVAGSGRKETPERTGESLTVAVSRRRPTPARIAVRQPQLSLCVAVPMERSSISYVTSVECLG